MEAVKNAEKLTYDYESVLVVSGKLGEEGANKVIDYFKGVIERHATLTSVKSWGKRPLAYEIKKEREGFYVLFNFTSEADFPAVLDRRYKITDGVLRSLIVKKDETDDAEVKAEADFEAEAADDGSEE